MKKFVFFLLVSSLLFSSTCSPQTQTTTTVDMTPRLISTSQTLSSSQIAETVRGAIVGISAKLSNGTSIGSGVAIADGGYILTNYHVISGQKSITLYYADGTNGNAQYVWGNAGIDLAILKSAQNLPYLDTCPLEEVNIGDDVLAVGTPLSLQFKHTFTKGIISALNRTIEISSIGGVSSYMQNLIQHDASINSGNSGGPLINTQGKIIGINSLKASNAEGIGFAIPIETATAIASKIIPNNNFKEIHLGFFGQDASVAKFQKLTQVDQGVFVVDIENTSKLKNSGLKNGDIITAINGKKINNMLDLRKAVFALDNNSTITLEIFDGQTKKIITTVV